jgi:integrase/recombinase XerD
MSFPSKEQKRDSVFYTDDEMELILAAMSRRTKTGIRDRAAVMVMWRGMLRVRECLQLRVADLDLKTGELRVLHGKGDKPRTVGLPPSALDCVGAWLDVRKTLSATKMDPMFCSLYGKPLHPSHFRHKLPRIAAKIDLGKRLHAHGFRHSGAVRMKRKGTDTMDVSRGLGHSNIATTEKYLHHLRDDSVIAAMREE